MDHECIRNDCIEILMASYPHAVWRCSLCNQVMKMTPFDDLPEDELTKVEAVLARHKGWRKNHGGGHGD
jgi:hypothetical protein